MVSCNKCDRDLNVDPVEKPDLDWMKIVCSNCGEVREVSMVRLAATSYRK